MENCIRLAHDALVAAEMYGVTGSGLIPEWENPMIKTVQSSLRNHLLRRLSPSIFAPLRSKLHPVDLQLREVLVEPDQPTANVFFLESGLASLVANSLDGEQAEVGHVGREGLTGSHVLLGTDRTPNRTFMQSPGSALRISVPDLLDAVASEPALRDLLLRYIHSREIQLSHSALANGRYSINERLARWLLMCHDRLESDDLQLTHEFLSLMLGVRRSGVTNELHVIEGIGAIKATRGQIRILDRARLEEIAGGCYGLPEREYERLIGASFRRTATVGKPDDKSSGQD